MTDPLILAHLSDPHLPLGRPSLAEAFSKRGLSFFNWQRKRRHLHRPEVTRSVVADMLSAKPDFIAMTGDLVNFSLEREFAAGAEWLAALGDPARVGVIPGNHEALVAGFEARMRRHWVPWLMGDDGFAGFPWRRRIGDVLVIGVSSAVPTLPFLATGRVDAPQLTRLAGLLRAGAGLCRVVLIHHPPTNIIEARKALTNRAAFQQVIAAEGAELVLHGHSHRADLSWIDTPAGRVPVIGAPACGMRAGARYDPGAWRRLELARDDSGWRLTLAERHVTPAGDMAARAPLVFRLPHSGIARAAATA